MVDVSNPFPTGVPLKEPNDMYLQFMINHVQNMTALMMNAKGDTDISDIEAGARTLIACVVDKERKNDLRMKFSGLVREVKTDDELTNSEKTKLIKECCIMVIDEVWNFLDELMALVTENVVWDIVNGDENIDRSSICGSD